MLSPHLYELLVQVAHLRTLVNLQLPRLIQRIQPKSKNIVIIPLYHDDLKDTGHSYGRTPSTKYSLYLLQLAQFRAVDHRFLQDHKSFFSKCDDYVLKQDIMLLF